MRAALHVLLGLLPLLLCHCQSMTRLATPPSHLSLVPSLTPADTSSPSAVPLYPSYPAGPSSLTSSDSGSPPAKLLRSLTLQPAATFHETSVSSAAGRLALRSIIFDSRTFRLAVIDQPLPRAGGRIIAETLRSRRALAGVNGGFFTPEFQPLGLVISAGRTLSPAATSPLITGMIVQTESLPYLLWNAEYPGPSGISDALQAGPRLLDSGLPVPGLDQDRKSTRSFIATDGGFLWAVGTADSCSLGTLASALLTAGALPGLSPMRALNLDGGRSSALWFRDFTGAETSRPGWSTVRNYLAIIPR